MKGNKDQQAVKALGDLRENLPLDCIVDVVDARIRERYESTRRSRRNLYVAILTLLATVASVAVAILIFVFQSLDSNFDTLGSNLTELNREVRGNRLAAESREVVAHITPEPTATLQPGDATRVALVREGRGLVRLEAPQGRYRVDADAVDPAVVTAVSVAPAVDAPADPVLTLYRRMDNGPLASVDSNDDGGEGFNARLDIAIQDDYEYFAEVREFVGLPAVVRVSFTRLSEEE